MQEKNPNASYDTATGKTSIVAAGGPAHKTTGLHLVYQQSAEQKPEQAKAAALSYRGQETGGI